jgi:hypothetical protein
MSVDCIIMVGSVVPVVPLVVVVLPVVAVAREPAAPEPVGAAAAGVEPEVAEADAPALADAAPEAPPDCGGIGPRMLVMSVAIRLMIDRDRSLLVV